MELLVNAEHPAPLFGEAVSCTFPDDKGQQIWSSFQKPKERLEYREIA